MLKVNVGMSRKLSKDYNSTGFSLNLEGELAVPLDDPEAVIEKIREFYDLADEALRDQIDRHESDSAIASRDVEPPATNGTPPTPGKSATNNGQTATGSNGNGTSGNTEAARANGDAATNKQVQFMLTLGKRQGKTTKQLETEISQIVGRQVGVYDLTKREAAAVLDALTQMAGTGRSNGR